MITRLNNVFSNSSALMATLLDLHFPTGSIIDATYGLGVFYKNVPHRIVVGVDWARGLGAIRADSRRLPFADDSFDVGVCDPPYKRGDGARYEHRYGVAPHTEQQVTRLYEAILPELLRVSRQGLIVKVQDGTDGHKFYPRHIQIAGYIKEMTGLDPHDIAVVARSVLPCTLVRGRQHFFRQGVSYFLVYKWRNKFPFRPIRF